VWNGGPVDKDRGIVLHNRRVSSDDRCVGSLNIYLSDTEESIHRLCDFEATYLGGGDYGARSEIPAINSFRFILGYAGWGPKQLLQEIELGAWFVLPYSERILYETPHDMIWSEAMQILSINKDSIITQSNFTIQ
jgi:putative transcriptional regulator